MTASRSQLTSFERILFTAAVVLAGLLILVRVGATLLLSFLHHVR